MLVASIDRSARQNALFVTKQQSTPFSELVLSSWSYSLSNQQNLRRGQRNFQCVGE
jgi:hypothetical protein